MKYPETMLTALEVLGKRFFQEYMSAEKRKRSRLCDNWFEAFKFLLSKLYLRGRSNRLAESYFEAMHQCLDDSFASDPAGKLEMFWGRGDIPHEPQWWMGEAGGEPFYLNKSSLGSRFTPKMGNPNDHQMVLDALRYIYPLKGHNVVMWSLEEIRAGRIREHREELMELYEVGKKLSALYLRDLVYLFDCHLKPDEAKHIQPIDTLVRQVAHALLGASGCGGNAPSAEEWFIDLCVKRDDYMLLNAGAWYLGKHSFELLIALLANDCVSPEALERITRPRAKPGDDVTLAL